MIEFIISILVPILGGLGVSEADVTTYVTNCSGYIYAILISILVLIVLLVAAHFIAPKGKRHLVRWGASLAWVLALVTMPQAVEEYLEHNNPKGDKINPIEVKSGNYRGHKSLDMFCDKYSSRIRDKYVVHTKDYKWENGIHYLPVYMIPFL